MKPTATGNATRKPMIIIGKNIDKKVLPNPMTWKRTRTTRAKDKNNPSRRRSRPEYFIALF